MQTNVEKLDDLIKERKALTVLLSTYLERVRGIRSHLNEIKKKIEART